MAETEAEFVERIEQRLAGCNLLAYQTHARIFALVRRGAAAGELVEAAKLLVDVAGNGHPGQDRYWAAIKTADAAIAKFEGLTTQQKETE